VGPCRDGRAGQGLVRELGRLSLRRAGRPDTVGRHWLQQKPGNVYSYDVRVATSSDAGRSWSTHFSPHDDGTPTEHGFVSLYAGTAAWGRSGSTDATPRAATITTATRRRDDAARRDDRRRRRARRQRVRARRPRLRLLPDGRGAHGGGPCGRVPRPQRARAARHRAGTPRRRALVAARARARGRLGNRRLPVNGPAVDARERTVVVAWFTAPDTPRVRLAFSTTPDAVSRRRSRSRPVRWRDASTWCCSMTARGRELAAAVARRRRDPRAAVHARGCVGSTGDDRLVDREPLLGVPADAARGDGLLLAWTASGEAMGCVRRSRSCAERGAPAPAGPPCARISASIPPLVPTHRSPTCPVR